MLQIVASLIDAARGVIYDRHMVIVQATEVVECIWMHYLNKFCELRGPLRRVQRLPARLAERVEDGHDGTDRRPGVNVERPTARLQLVRRDAQGPPEIRAAE